MTQAPLRRLPRPRRVEQCSHCGEACGTNYPACPVCYEAAEKYWLADWRALLAQEAVLPGTSDETVLAQVVLAEVEQHAWSIVDVAMTLVQCSGCEQELGGGPIDCSACATAWGNVLWVEGVAFRQGVSTENEHALHVGRMVLRHPHRHSAAAVQGWRMSYPRLLTGWLPSTEEAQRMMAWIKAGRMAEAEAALRSIDRAIARAAQE
jgi:hypothetical protein